MSPPEPANHRRRRREAGFTLVELMVVILIIGLLATIVAFNVLSLGEQSKVQKARADIGTIEQALDLYKLQQGSYPAAQDGLRALVVAPAGITDPARYPRGGYIKKLPQDPWGHDYRYRFPGAHGDVDIWSQGADGQDGGEGDNADITSWDASRKP
ncbi:type II secretion system major pseudopilin GspG [Sphingomonas sp.]|uniref:type II secretion system major pseudopilin GspG n=1 Tax=Sphingomonas sp. TaxID=28214 RepID=UPI001D7394A0|nr:type II secretion system major pseudopilin GspG [Sphingomonas sp.]MBX9795562.1 type II secretion system major pseudopilin GspG [Sphingomonas sp.]